MKLLHMVTASPARTPTLHHVRRSTTISSSPRGTATTARWRRPACSCRVSPAHLRLEPRRRAAGHHPHLAGDGRARRAPRGTQRRRLLRPHRRAPDHAGAARPQGLLRPRRPRPGREARTSRRCRMASATATRTSSSSPALYKQLNAPLGSVGTQQPRLRQPLDRQPTIRPTPSTSPRSAPSRAIATRSRRRSRRRSTTRPSRNKPVDEHQEDGLGPPRQPHHRPGRGSRRNARPRP